MVLKYWTLWLRKNSIIKYKLYLIVCNPRRVEDPIIVIGIDTAIVSVGSTKPNAAKGGLAHLYRVPKKSRSSMSNIHITFGETEATEFKCIPMQVLVEVENGSTKPAYVHIYL